MSGSRRLGLGRFPGAIDGSVRRPPRSGDIAHRHRHRLNSARAGRTPPHSRRASEVIHHVVRPDLAGKKGRKHLEKPASPQNPFCRRRCVPCGSDRHGRDRHSERKCSSARGYEGTIGQFDGRDGGSRLFRHQAPDDGRRLAWFVPAGERCRRHALFDIWPSRRVQDKQGHRGQGAAETLQLAGVHPPAITAWPPVAGTARTCGQPLLECPAAGAGLPGSRVYAAAAAPN